MDDKDKDVWKLLPRDIQVDILNRLSTKDLNEVENVCKDWQSIIKSPRFHMLQIQIKMPLLCIHLMMEESAKFNHWL